MQKDLSPEEKLLRLIKGKRKEGEASEKKPETPSEFSPKPSFAKEASSADPTIETKPVISNILTKGKTLDPFKTAVFLLIAIFVVGIFYFIYDFSARKQQSPIVDVEELISSGAEPAEGIKEIAQKPTADAKEKPPAEEEEEPPELRELFGAPVTRETAPVVEEGPSIAELAKDLVLVGVITGDNPQAIIQNKKTRQSFYVYEGEGILEFKVKQIEKAMVILEYKGETLKMSL